MKKILAIILLAALAFTGCGKNDDGESGGGNEGSTKGTIVGTWLCTGQLIWENNTWIEDEDVVWQGNGIEAYSSDGYCKFYDVEDNSINFSNGYLYGKTLSDFHLDSQGQYYVKDGFLYVGGGICKFRIQFKSQDVMYQLPLETDQFDENDAWMYRRIKGFK